MLYLGPDSEIDDGTLPISPSVPSVSSPYCCCYCGSPISRPRRRSRMQQQHQLLYCHQHQQPNHHAYANLIRSIGSSTLPSVSRRNHHHQTAPIVFPEKPSTSRDVPVDHNRRGVFSTSSTVSWRQTSSLEPIFVFVQRKHQKIHFAKAYSSRGTVSLCGRALCLQENHEG